MTPKASFEYCVQSAAHFDPEERHCQFANGWYRGYAGHFVGSIAYSGPVAKGVSETATLSARLSKAAKQADDVTPTARGAGTKTSIVNHRLIADGGNPYVDYPAVRHGLEERGFSTSGSLERATTRLDAIDYSVTRHLTTREQVDLAVRLSRSENPRATQRFINDLEHASDVRYFLDEELATTNRLVDLHANKHRTTGQTRGVSNRHLDPDLEANDFVHVARNSDVDEVQLIVRGSEEFQSRGSVQWLESGDSGSGLEHVVERHAGNFHGNSRLDVSNTQDIKNTIYRTMKEGDAHRIPKADGGGTAYIQEINRQDVTVIAGDNGYVITSHPGLPVNIEL